MKIVKRLQLLLLVLSLAGCGGSGVPMPEPSPALSIDFAILATGNADATPIDNDHLVKVWKFINRDGEAALEMDFNVASADPTVYRSVAINLPSESAMSEGETVTWNNSGERGDYYTQVVLYASDDPDRQAGQLGAWTKSVGQLHVKKVEGRTYTLEIDSTMQPLGPSTGTLRLAGTITVDFARQPDVFPDGGES